MAHHPTGTREEWLAARLELLDAEKELTRRSDELARQRQQLPWYRRLAGSTRAACDSGRDPLRTERSDDCIGQRVPRFYTAARRSFVQFNRASLRLFRRQLH